MNRLLIVSTVCGLALWQEAAMAQNIVDENFDVANIPALMTRGWTYYEGTPSAPTTSISTTSFMGGGALKMTYVGPNCTNVGVCHDELNSAIAKTHTPVTTIYTRQWSRYDPVDSTKPSDFVSQYDASAKQIYFNDGGADPVFSTILGYYYYEGTSNSPAIDIQRSGFTTTCPSGTTGTTCIYPPNKAVVSIPRGAWVCIESEQTLNDPGSANGIIRTWVGEKLTAEYTNVVYRNSAAGMFRKVKLFRQGAINMNRYEDNFAVSSTGRIYCGDAPPPPNVARPATPKNVQVE